MTGLDLLTGGDLESLPARNTRDVRTAASAAGQLVRRGYALVSRRGAGFLWYLAAGVAWPKLAFRLLGAAGTGIGTRRPGSSPPLASPPPKDRERSAPDSEPAPLASLAPPAQWLERLRAAHARAGGADLVVARPDDSGEWEWLYPLAGTTALPAPLREHSGLQEDVVFDGSALQLRRTYARHDRAFSQERDALTVLGGIAGVPRLVRVDPSWNRLYLALTRGTRLDHLSADARTTGVIERHADAVLHQLHTAGVTGAGVAPAHIVVAADGQTPVFHDFSRARVHTDRSSVRFAIHRDRDRTAFNRACGAALLTETSVRALLDEHRGRLTRYQDYAPIDFGGGVTLGNILTTDSGTGRWEFFNASVVAPLIAGRRVLDLGSNNGSMPTAMLQSGAREVVCVERDPALADLCELSARIREWRDMRPYALEVHREDMRAFLDADWGTFDTITAFCSLYYIPEDDMAAIVRRAAAMHATVILQSNEGIDPSLRRVASADFLEQLLRSAGYRRVRRYAPPGYTRVLLVAEPDGSVG